ncbi:MAG TPA: adenine phosphoribosyltransferase [Candidatus Nitrosopelagicus sp.]|nr:adenine phosphoribosyltransferase [Candidatus Nitrosopelagicus sp.]
MNLRERINEYKDFPKKGILFRDFSPMLKDHSAMSVVVEEFKKNYHPKDVDVFVGIESRGFILASILAQKYNKGMVLLRKAGKLPGKTVKTSYTIEYGKAVLEIQKTALNAGERVVICDDLLATGGTAQAAVQLIVCLRVAILAATFDAQLPGRYTKFQFSFVHQFFHQVEQSCGPKICRHRIVDPLNGLSKFILVGTFIQQQG